MHPRPRAARPWTLPRRAPDLSSAPTLSTPLVATLTAAAAGRPPFARRHGYCTAVVLCVAAMSAQCGSISAVSTCANLPRSYSVEYCK